MRLARAGADVVAIDACGPVAEHNGYAPATPEDLAETVSLVEGEGRKILADEVDVRDAAGQQRVVADAIEQFGRLDIVVANAGVLNWGRLWEISAAAVAGNPRHQPDRGVEHHQSHRAADDRRPATVDRSSTSVRQPGSRPCPAAGTTAPASSVSSRLTNSLAVELGEFGIRVNSVHPYGTDTPMGNDVSMYQMFADHPNYIHSFSPGALPTDSLAAPNLVSDIVCGWPVTSRRW